MACDASKGRLEPCDDNYAGLKAMYVANFTAGLLDSATFDGTDDDITAFGSLLTLFKYDLSGGVHNFDENGNVSRDNGTSYFEQTGSVFLKSQNMATRKELQVLQKGKPHIIVEDYQGNYRMGGIENGCKVTVSSVSGSAPADQVGYNVTWTAMEKTFAHFIDSTIIDDATNTSVTVGT